MVRVVAVRHGESTFNRSGTVQGHAQSSVLTGKGRRQARALAAFLKGKYVFERIYSSDLPRCAEQARILSTVPGQGVVYTRQLRELDTGRLTGMPYTCGEWLEVQDALAAGDESAARRHGFESFSSAFGRASGMLALAELLNGTVLFVSHGGLLKIMVSLTLGESITEHLRSTRGRLVMPSCCVNEFEYENGVWTPKTIEFDAYDGKIA